MIGEHQPTAGMYVDVTAVAVRTSKLRCEKAQQKTKEHIEMFRKADGFGGVNVLLIWTSPQSLH